MFLRKTEILLCLFLVAGCATFGKGIDAHEAAKSDLILEGTSLKVRKLGPGSVADAIEEGPTNIRMLEALVYFKVEKVLKGKISDIHVEGESRIKKAREALLDRNIKELLSARKVVGDQKIKRNRFRVAVSSPFDMFGIQSWDNPTPQRYRLYFKKYPKGVDTYVMIHNEWLPPAGQ